MKVFSAFDDVKGKNGSVHESGGKAMKAASKKVAKKPVATEAQKQEKLEELKNKKETAVSDKDEVKLSKKAEAKKEIFNLHQEKADEDGKVAKETKAVLPKSDIAKNDPNDPVTKEKLKSVLTSGAMSFNGSERKVLESILAEA